jgi:hypothetical protein
MVNSAIAINWETSIRYKTVPTPGFPCRRCAGDQAPFGWLSAIYLIFAFGGWGRNADGRRTARW